MIAAATIGAGAASPRTVRPSRAADDRESGKKHVALKRANLVIARLRTKE
jgi:hypothetical protein